MLHGIKKSIKSFDRNYKMLSETKESLTMLFHFSRPESPPLMILVEAHFFLTEGTFCRFINCRYSHHSLNLDSGGQLRKTNPKHKLNFICDEIRLSGV